MSDSIPLNVRGIRDLTKRRSIFSYLKDQKAMHFIFYKKPTPKLMMKMFGNTNGEDNSSSLMVAITVEVSAF